MTTADIGICTSDASADLIRSIGFMQPLNEGDELSEAN